jgi:transcriptional regulator with XRE-family HTH domain
MNKLDIFSQNLRRECARFESIAAVCRSANINRQQFSKYLAGSALPSATVLRKICSALNVQEKTLFAELQPKAEQGKTEVSILTLEKLVKDFGGAASAIRFGEIDFPSGNYYCYILLAHVPGMVVRTLVQVKKIDWCVSFTRITKLPSGRKDNMSKGRHKGIIIGNASEYYFIGVNRYSPNQLSFMSVERQNGTNERHYTGLAVTRNGNAAFAAKFCLVPISPKLKMRDVLNSLGLVHQTELRSEAYVVVSLLQ